MIIDSPMISDIPSLKSLWREAFGDTEEFLASFFTTAFNTKRCRCVKVDGTVKAALYWFDCSYKGERLAYIYGVATAKDYRGRGLSRALMEDTHRHAESLGYMGAILVPGSKGLFSFYERLGYKTCSFVSEFICSASSTKAELRQIDADEYAKLRRAFLPKDSVIQENENLKFLQIQADFYTGDDFLLTAKCEGNTLYGVELLGNTHTAPSVVAAFECTKGQFRTPGDNKPFAMYRPLHNKNTLPPTYFGLAFD